MNKRERRYVETEEYVRFLHRIMKALGSRVADADIEMLRSLADLPTLVESLLTETVTRLRTEHGYSWADIGRALGITRQSAHERFRCQADPDTEPANGPANGPGADGGYAAGYADGWYRGQGAS